MSGVSIVGTGAISAAGLNADEAFKHISEGKTALQPLSLFDSGMKINPLAGEISEDPQKLLPYKTPNRSTALAMLAVEQSLCDISSLKGLKLGLFNATTVGGMTESELFYDEYLKDKSVAQKASEIFSNHEPASMSSFIAQKIGACGFHTLSTACSTSLHSLGLAKRAIENGTYDLAIALGVDGLSILTMRGFASLMLVDPGGCKPFDKKRLGITIGEGAGALLLASDKAVEELNLNVKAKVLGWGASADCYHMTAPHPDGEGALNAAKMALSEAEISPDKIDMILAHGTATPDNDLAETKALSTLFDTIPPFTSLKGIIGHTLAASGTLEVVYGITAMEQGIVPPSAAFDELDDDINIAPCNGENKEINYFMKNAFGFGGNNAVTVISSPGAN